MTVRRRLTWLVPLTILAGGCGGQETRDQAHDPAQAPSASETPRVLVSCFGGPGGWPPAVTVDGIHASVSDAEIREGFRQMLADPASAGELQLSFLRDGADDTKFHVLKEEGSALTLALGHWTAAGPDEGSYIFSMTRGDGGWKWSGGASCPQLGPTLSDDAFSWVELSAPVGGVDRSTSDIEVGVTEMACTGGRDPLPHLNEPEVVTDDHAVTVYWTSRRDAPAGQAFACPGPLPTMTTLHLNEPLGDRKLLDGSVYPPTPIR